MKPAITVVGGFYRENCRFPASDEFWGSGGRGAAAIAKLPIGVKFVTAAAKDAETILASIAQAVGFEYSVTPVAQTIVFRYDHGLSTPIIWPPLNELDRIHLAAKGECILQFGMLDADVEVDARTVIYDPQEPFSPKHFRSANRPSRLAYVLNRTEAKQLGMNHDVEEAIRKISHDSQAEVVIVKQGARGALIFANGQFATVPAYASKNVWPIGSGDVFASVFAARWGTQKMSAVDAADSASRATAEYVGNRTLPIAVSAMDSKNSAVPLRLTAKPLGKDEFDVYVAGPFFNMPQIYLVDEARAALQGMGLRVFSPYHDIGIGPGSDVAPKDIDALEKSRAVIAILDGVDTGTVFEAGYARAHQKPVIAFAQCTPEESLKMIAGTGCEVVDDFVTAIYRVAWAAWR
jgi:nucleoside 2-deoxyribosyltransferase/hydroxymethylpyrimidine/phosphomethylpyrimidine kinase